MAKDSASWMVKDLAPWEALTASGMAKRLVPLEGLTVPVTCLVGFPEWSKETVPVIPGSRPGQTIDRTIRPTSFPLNRFQIVGRCRPLTTDCPPSCSPDHLQFAGRRFHHLTTGCPPSCLPGFLQPGVCDHHHPASWHTTCRLLSSLRLLLQSGARARGDSDRTRWHGTVSCGAYFPSLRSRRASSLPRVAKDTSIDR